MRPVVLAGVAVAAVLGAVALAVGLPSQDGTDGGRDRPAAAGQDGGEGPDGGRASTGPSAAASRSAPASAGPTAGPAAPRGGGAGKGRAAATPTGADGDDGTGPPPLTVATRPYTWESPCDQHYLIAHGPGEVAPPPVEQDAPAWVAVAGAVSSGRQYLTLTVQGTRGATVVVDSLRVREAGRRPPLAWNDYAMGYPGVGCGGGVPTRSFTVALDAARPVVVPEAGHRNFPFKVSESDPEVFYVTADASAYDVSWYLELSWSSGDRHGTLRIDDRGRPFRTSGAGGRPGYEFPLGGKGWVPAGSTTP
ncbi:hypothetical protein [Streptomyces tropicalis]|uniref:Transcriptional regulator n=1 Tax=Streptomyces tropicalis TaxID=3034234 RepID=A0ABT6AB08_9ACTN|nr:hypothetical protein [Streptomyces tropicalis]MDF3301843.1 hypothetical protein [Streptomyces tropicalis]